MRAGSADILRHATHEQSMNISQAMDPTVQTTRFGPTYTNHHLGNDSTIGGLQLGLNASISSVAGVPTHQQQ